MGRARHLVRRFATSVRGRTPDAADETWARSLLTDAEIALWERMTPTDRAHAVEVARRTALELDDPAVLAAALLHDVGKIEAQAGAAVRVVASLVGPVVSDARAAQLAGRTGVAGTLGRLRGYPALGANLLAGAGSARLVIQWAAEHHAPRQRWTVPANVGRVLQAADNKSS